MAASDLAVPDLASLGQRSAFAQFVVGFELAADADEVDGVEPDPLDSLPDAAFVSGFTSDFASVFESGFFSAVVLSALDELLFGA